MSTLKRSPQEISATRGKVTALNALATAAFSTFAISNAYDHPTRTPAYVLLWALWMVVTSIWVFGAPGARSFTKAERDIVNDELTRSQQASAAKFGLAFALIWLVSCSLYGFLGFATPIWTLPALTSATVVATALFFAWIQTRYD